MQYDKSKKVKILMFRIVVCKRVCEVISLYWSYRLEYNLHALKSVWWMLWSTHFSVDVIMKVFLTKIGIAFIAMPTW